MFAPDGTEVSCRSLSLSLVVLAAFIHATWNLLSKRAADAGPTFVFAYNLFACLVYLPWMIWLLVYGDLHWSLPVAGCLVLSACIHLAYSLCLQRGYQVADLSVVYPIARGTGPLLSSIGAFILLRETPTAQGIFGLLAVVAGIGFITTQGDLSAFRRPRGLDGVRWGTATGSLIAGYTVVDGYGVKMLGIHPVVLDWVTNLLRFFIMLPIVLSNLPRAEEKMKGYWLAGVRGRRAVAAVLHPRAVSHRDGRAAQPGRARARNVDDGRRAVRHADPRRAGHGMAGRWACAILVCECSVPDAVHSAAPQPGLGAAWTRFCSAPLTRCARGTQPHTGFSSSVTGEVITRNTRSTSPEFEIACSTPGGRKMKSCLRTTWFLPAISISPSPSST